MKKELEMSLVTKYPLMFRDYGGDPYETCMNRGMEHGNGWFEILSTLCENIEKELQNHQELREKFKFTQVKEKFGRLRVYFDGANEIIWNLAYKSEEDSGIVCEQCGTRDNVSANETGWIRTLCTNCRKN